jgi:sirohydrochlorin cobaltochelatase
VFAELRAGDYILWKNNQPDDELTIAGGAIAEVDWRDLAFTPALRLARPHPAIATVSQPAASAYVPDALLPRRYRNSGPVRSTPMGSAPMRYTQDGQVAWDEMWTDFCDLALAGGPPHRDTVLDPPAPDPALSREEAYRRVVSEIERGIQMVTGLRTVVSQTPGWVGLQCEDEDMARWLLRAIAVENVGVRREGSVLFLPAGPDFRLDKEIKNVVTVVAKTHHYYSEHLLD